MKLTRTTFALIFPILACGGEPEPDFTSSSSSSTSSPATDGSTAANQTQGAGSESSPSGSADASTTTGDFGSSGDAPDTNDTAKEPTTSDPTTTGDEPGELCQEFCAAQTECSTFPLDDCLDVCEETRGFFARSSAACREAVDEPFSCMGGQTCASWSDEALPDGSCGPSIAAQSSDCRGAGLYAGWDACVATCRHAVTECEVVVKGISTYQSFDDCWGECKLNSLIDADLGCIGEGLRYDECELALDCVTLESHLNDDVDAAPECAALGEAWVEACTAGA